MLEYLSKIKQWFLERKLLVSVLIGFLFFQLFFCFLSPACGFGGNWLPISDYLPKFSVETSDNFLLKTVYPLVSTEYRLNSDVGGYLELAKNFNRETFQGHVFLSRPLYSFLVFSIASVPAIFIGSSYSIIFASAILLNFILIAVSVLLFFWLIEKLFSKRVAFLSSILLIFSPYVHGTLIQPMGEMLAIFTVILSVCLLRNYAKKSSFFKLVIFSLIIGILMMGKMFFAIPFFILLLAIYFKRYKEGLLFSFILLIPFGLWYIWVTKVWGIEYFVNEIQNWNMGVWIFNIFYWPWHKTAKIFLDAIPNFITALIYGFILIPVIFSIIGFSQWQAKFKNIFCFTSVSALFALCFGMNLYLYRHLFLLFPIVYPTAVLGMDRIANALKRYNPLYFYAFYGVIIGLIIIISNINFYKVFDYLKSQ